MQIFEALPMLYALSVLMFYTEDIEAGFLLVELVLKYLLLQVGTAILHYF